jgi:riboflavin transporter
VKTFILNVQKIIALRLSLIIYFLSFSFPLLLSSSQLVTGTIINSLFFISSEKLDKKALYPMLVLPSLGALTHGFLFGPQTIFLFYFLPFIWVGNYLQVNVFSLMKKQNYLSRIFSAGLAKYLLLFVAAIFYYKFNIVPQLFITSMGTIQFVTALMGGLLAYLVLQLLKKNE